MQGHRTRGGPLPPPAEQPLPPGRVDQVAGLDGPLVVGHPPAADRTRRPVRPRGQHGGSRQAGVLEQQRIEPDPIDGEPVRHVDALLVGGTPAHAGLDDPDTDRLDGRPIEAKCVQQRPRARAERLPERGPGLVGQHRNPISQPGERCGRGGTGRAAADHADVDLGRHGPSK